MIKTISTICTAVLFSLSVNHAYAACETPSAPDAPSAKPSLPICMSGYKSTGKHDCSSTEAENHIDKINDYMKKLNTYASDAITYANAAQQFAKCSAEEAKEGLK